MASPSSHVASRASDPFPCADHELLVGDVTTMVTIPPRCFAVIANPVGRTEDGGVERDATGQLKLRHGDQEIRFTQDPFPLYPGERLVGSVSPLQIVPPATALRLTALRDTEITKPDGTVEVKRAGDEWLFEGPATYLPVIEVKVEETVVAVIIKPNSALRLRARKSFTDRKGVARKAGEEWLVREDGSYLPDVDEEIVDTVQAYVLTDRKALQLMATRSFTDQFNNKRKAGEQWLVTMADSETHIPDVYEKVVREVTITTLTNRQYCIVLDPVGADGKQRFGHRELRVGDQSFFLQPGERLDSGIQDVYVLGQDEGLLLQAREQHDDEVDGTAHKRRPGDKWMIYGPRDYVPPCQVDILEKRVSIPLDEGEGIYVRNQKTGAVRAIMGESYMLLPEEELWEKELPPAVEELLARNLDPLADRQSYLDGKSGAATSARDRSRVVTLRAPHNSAVQVYDYRAKTSRVVFGPDMIALGPDEQFTLLSLSGDKPKRPNVIKSIALLMGPDFMTDVITVETSDHARLQLQLSYNWFFDVEKGDEAGATAMFQVPDFVGDACKAIASRVRSSVAAVPFDAFHKSSAKIIRSAVFGIDEETGKIRNRFEFTANRLVITNIDIQSVEPVDQKTRDSLQKSVQLAIEITTKSQEAAARHEAERVEQEARGRLERQKINDEAEAEKSRKELLQLQSQSAAVESTGQANAEARARAEALMIEGEANVKQARLKAEALAIEGDAELAQVTRRQEADLEYQSKVSELEITKSRESAAIESQKFKNIVDAIGADTIKSIAQAGPEMQAKLLQGLGLNGFLITDGSSPINLFQTANGMINPMSQNPAGQQ